MPVAGFAVHLMNGLAAESGPGLRPWHAPSRTPGPGRLAQRAGPGQQRGLSANPVGFFSTEELTAVVRERLVADDPGRTAAQLAEEVPGELGIEPTPRRRNSRRKPSGWPGAIPGRCLAASLPARGDVPRLCLEGSAA